ncbi:MAG: HDIG domain-containing metalloprotein [Simkaniaceae bacterium]
MSEKERGKRLFIAFLLLLSLALFLHFREVRVETLDPDTAAQRYVVAQVDFEFPDEESSTMIRRQASSAIGPIYRLDTETVQSYRLNFEKEIVSDPSWRAIIEGDGFDVIYNASEKVEEILLESQFTDPRTLQKIKELSISTRNFQPLVEIQTEEAVVLPREYWQRILQDLPKSNNNLGKAIQSAVAYFSKHDYQLVRDTYTQEAIKEVIEAKIPPKYSKVKAGSPIINQGQKVTPRHLAMLQGMKQALAEKQSLWRPTPIIGSLIFALIILSLGAFYFAANQPEFFRSTKNLSLFATIVILTLIIAKVTEYFMIHNVNHLIDDVRYPLFVPFAAILLAVLINSEIAFFTSVFLSVIIGISLAFEHNRMLVLNLITGIVAIVTTRNLSKRKEVFAVSAKVWLVSIPILIGYNFIENLFFNVTTFTDISSSLIFMVITAILIVGVLPILESIFHVMTDITLMEYMDPNNELLRRLSIEAPGTYQHSLVVGSLSEAAAQAIGANGLFCRVSTLYHDIGKLMNPHYFTENQMGGFNIHQLLTPQESTQVIIAHVPEGVALAKKHGLPEGIIDVIKQHHGTTLVYYFYCKMVEQMGGDTDAVEEAKFRYPGPKPRSKESAIIMIADTVEAASRSVEDPSEDSLNEMVERLVSDKADEGQFDECQLTFEELGIVKKTIVRTLAVTRHLRVKYPERKR